MVGDVRIGSRKQTRSRTENGNWKKKRFHETYAHENNLEKGCIEYKNRKILIY